jgi:iron complex transport system ATP-binding protein
MSAAATKNAQATKNTQRSTVNRLSADNVTLGYDQRVIAEKLSVEIPDNSFTVIVGPNACGKSTLLRALSRMLKPSEGRVLLDGQVIQSMPAKKVARTLGLLPQSSIAPDGITVGDLVGRGRYPHQGLLRQWSTEDERVVQESMASTGVAELADRYVDELSGGQRQRVWIAMALAQQTPLLLLDEPTTYLDIQHQIDVLDLCAELHEEQGRTLVAVLHDLNHAARYATHLIALREGRVIAEGAPNDIVTAELVEEVFGLRCQVIDDPETGTPLVVPAARKARVRVAAGAAGAGAASSRTRPEPQALAKFSSPSTMATRSSPDMASLIWAFSWGSPWRVSSTWIRPSVRRPTKVMSRSVIRQLSERSRAAASRTFPSAPTMLSESLSSALRHSSIVAIAVDGTAALRGSVGA